jgi:uncharacterized protein (TIGR04255 family)
MGTYKPGAQAHAIDQAVVGVRVFGANDDAILNSAVSVASQLAMEHDLPGRLQLDPMSLIFGRQAISQGYATSGELAPGVLFQRVNTDGSMAEELTVERNAVTYRTRSYRRWDDVARLIRSIICPVAKVLGDGKVERLSVVELRCIDKFISDDEAPLQLSQLVRSDCPYVPPHMLHISELLHLHSGWFEDVNDDGRLLVNLNVDLGEENGRQVANLLQVISKQTSPLAPVVRRVDFDEAISEAFQKLHMIDKNLLSNVLTDELQAAINLTGDRGVTRS